MTVGPHDAKGKSPSLIAQGWISGAVVAVAAVMFVGIGSRLTLSLLGSTGSHRHPDPGLATAFILDIALLLLAWRRSVELKSAFAARDVAEQKAIELAWTDEATGLSNRRFLIERLVPDERIVVEWKANEPGTDYRVTVTMTFRPTDDGRTKVEIGEEGWHDTPAALEASYGNCMGWSQMVAALKMWLEHGINMRDGMYR